MNVPNLIDRILPLCGIQKQYQEGTQYKLQKLIVQVI